MPYRDRQRGGVQAQDRRIMTFEIKGLKRHFWCLAVFVFILCVSAFFLYQGMKNLRLEQVQKELSFEASVVCALLGHAKTININLFSKSPSLKTAFLETNRWVAIYDNSGNLLWSSIADLADKMNVNVEKGRWFGWQRHGANHMLFYAITAPFCINGKIAGVVRVGINGRELEPVGGEMEIVILWSIILLFLSFLILSKVLGIRIRRHLTNMSCSLEHVTRGELLENLAGASSQLKRLTIPNQSMSKLRNHIVSVLDLLAGKLNDCQERLERLDILFRNMKEAVFLLDNKMRIVTMNKVAEEVMNIGEKVVSGRLFVALFRDLELRRIMEDVFSGKKDRLVEIPLYSGKDGLEKRHFLVKVALLTEDRTGAITGALVVMDDITKLKRLENTRRQFVANVSHELKTPVTAIKGYTETLMDGVEDQETQKRFLGIIYRQAVRLENLVEDILALSRIERADKKTVVNKNPVNLFALFQRVTETCRPHARQKSIEILVKCHDHEFQMGLDGLLMEQALTNLLINAINYSPNFSTVMLSSSVKNDILKIDVKDQGCGISKKDIKHIFERFYRVDKARSRRLGGTGLGLAIVKHIVKAHGGTVEVKSKTGMGSTFTIFLPLSD